MESDPVVQATRRRPPTRRHVGVVACLALAGLGLSGCGNGNSGGAVSDVEQAQARVTAKEKALADAKDEFTAVSAAFCDASKSYVVAIDRYGDVLNATAPTVGDVKDAGSDLAAPRDEAVTGAQDAVEAQQKVVEAKQELADAKADLKQAKSGSTASPTAPSSQKPSSAPSPLAPAATVERVKSAEADFTQAQGAVTNQTSLVQAGKQFNAAAVALEMAWLQLYSDAGCLTQQEQEAQLAVAEYTVALQQGLASAGHYQGEIDGVYGPETVAAVESLQKQNGLPVTGAVDKATAATLDAELAAKGGVAAQQTAATTAAVQQTLKLAGFWDGPVDGTWTPALTEALKRFQTELGVKPTGSVDTATVQALEKAIAEASHPTSGSTTPSASPSPSEPVSPTAS